VRDDLNNVVKKELLKFLTKFHIKYHTLFSFVGKHEMPNCH